MGYFRCKDCDYFDKGFIYSYCTYKQSTVIGIGSPCLSFVNSSHECGECARYRENGKCHGQSGKRYPNHPSCEFFKPKY